MGERDPRVIEVRSSGALVGGGRIEDTLTSYDDTTAPAVEPSRGMPPVLRPDPMAEPGAVPAGGQVLDHGRWHGPRVFLSGAVCGAVLLLAFQYVYGVWTRFAEGRQDPLSKVSILDNGNPTQLVPARTFAKLDRLTETAWHLTWFQNYNRTMGGQPLENGVARLRSVVNVPDIEGSNLVGIYTNIQDKASVARNGTLYILQFGITGNSETFLQRDPTIFDDDAVERHRDTYLTGTFVTFYAPTPGAVDRTDSLRDFLKQFTQCPQSAGDCVPNPGVRNFSQWAARAG